MDYQVAPVLAITGPWHYPPTLTIAGIMTGTPAHLRRWMIPAFVPTLDSIDIASMSNAIARAALAP